MAAAVIASVLFVSLIGGLALPIAGWLTRFNPVERLALGVGAALLMVYLATFALFLSRLDWTWLWLLPAAGVALAWSRRATITSVIVDAGVQAVLAGWSLLALWCLGLQALVISYSGGTWAGDWFEHYERAHFFLHHWPLDHAFLNFGTLPARPPLANLVVAGLLGLSHDNFIPYQVHSTLLGTLLLFPLAALLADTDSRGPALRLLPLLLMLNPLFIQNATFPWTKLPAAYFIILGCGLLLRSLQRNTGHGLAIFILAAGLITHYSTGPWLVALGLAWLALEYRRLPAVPTIRRELLQGLLAGAGLVGTWVIWGAWNYGPGQLLQATSTIGQAPQADWAGRLTIAWDNLRHSLIPDWDSPLLGVLMQQADLSARLRDFCFLLYQQNLPVAFGLGNLCVLGWHLTKTKLHPAARLWLIAIPILLVLGTAVHTTRSELGLVHICLQPLILLGLSWVAIGHEALPRWLKVVWLTGLMADTGLGIALHFGLQSLLLPQLEHPGLTHFELIGRWVSTAMLNYGGKQHLAQPFLGDIILPVMPWLPIALLLLPLFTGWRWLAAKHKIASPDDLREP